MTAGGTVFWLTGLSSTGKSSVAAALRGLLEERGTPPVVVDGDRIREALPWPTGYERGDRLDLARLYGGLAREIAGQGHVVVVATVSLFHEVHAWNRANIPGYVEVWLRAPAGEIARRDRPRQVYAAGRPSVVGRDIVPEFPVAADVVIDNHGEMTPEDAARRILEWADA